MKLLVGITDISFAAIVHRQEVEIGATDNRITSQNCLFAGLRTPGGELHHG